jgi:hypothetical protein
MNKAALTLVLCLLVAGCGAAIEGTATWPGAVLARSALGPADVPAGVQFDRIIEQPGVPDGSGGPGPMLSRPEGCANALTKYAVGYDGARIVMTLLSWNLDMDALRVAAERCAAFEAFFDPGSEGIPLTTTELAGLDSDALAYRQTMTLDGASSSVFMAFQNIGGYAILGIAFPTPNPRIDAKASLPQTFLDIFGKQVAKMRAS